MPDLLKLVRERQTAGAEFNYGIMTADRYASLLPKCVGHDLCYRYGSKGNVSFNDALKRASNTLAYSNSDMVLKDVYSDVDPLVAEYGFELPKNTLMVFKHVLTTPRKDRDGDILRTKGAMPDPNMLLLWQHVHTMPIGKSLHVAKHTADELVMITAIVDLNELSHDSAVMIENRMGRFSHGFKALEFEKMKGTNGKEQSAKPTGGGFDVKRFEIMEESLVSVPANVDAEVVDIMLPLIENDKLTSSIMKGFGNTLREFKPVQSTGADFKSSETEDTDETGTKGSGGACCDACASGKPCTGKPGKESSSKETDADSDEGSEGAGTPEDDKMTECPKCEGKMDKNGTCTKCGYSMKDADEESEEKSFEKGFFGSMPGSFEELTNTLRTVGEKYFVDKGIITKSTEVPNSGYLYLAASYEKHAIFCHEKPGESIFYKVAWKSGKKGPEFFGEPEIVELKIDFFPKGYLAQVKAAQSPPPEVYALEDASPVDLAKRFVAIASDSDMLKLHSVLEASKQLAVTKQQTEMVRKSLGGYSLSR